MYFWASLRDLNTKFSPISKIDALKTSSIKFRQVILEQSVNSHTTEMLPIEGNFIIKIHLKYQRKFLLSNRRIKLPKLLLLNGILVQDFRAKSTEQIRSRLVYLSMFEHSCFCGFSEQLCNIFSFVFFDFPTL